MSISVCSSVYLYCSMAQVVNPEETKVFFPDHLQDQMEKAIQHVYNELQDDAPGWELMQSKPKYATKRKIGGTMIHVKATTELPFNLLDVFRAVVDIRKQKECDPNKETNDMFQIFSNHAWIAYVRIYGVRFW